MSFKLQCLVVLHLHCFFKFGMYSSWSRLQLLADLNWFVNGNTCNLSLFKRGDRIPDSMCFGVQCGTGGVDHIFACKL
jgi:hypothetical protein